jgi:hypothetical protein
MGTGELFKTKAEFQEERKNRIIAFPFSTPFE